MFIMSIHGEMRAVVQNWWLVKLFYTLRASISVLGMLKCPVNERHFYSRSSRDTRKIMHCISIAPFILKNATALIKACLHVSGLSGAFCRAVLSCGSAYRHGFGIYESFHQSLNHSSANTKMCYKIR